MVELLDSFEVLAGNHWISIELKKFVEALKSLEAMSILNLLQFKISVTAAFKDWPAVENYLVQHFQMEGSDAEAMRRTTFNTIEVISFEFFRFFSAAVENAQYLSFRFRNVSTFCVLHFIFFKFGLQGTNK